jgi:anti-sigma factor RsiW
MKLDDPKLTAFALDELDEPERSAMAQAVTESPEAQRFVAETRKMARSLEREFAVELQSEKIALPSRNDAFPAVDHTKRQTGDRRSLVDIPEEPWFWSRARPLALAAAVALLAILGAIVFGNFKSRRDFTAASPEPTTEIQAEETPQSEVLSEAIGPNKVPNPLRHDVVRRIERVVIGEFDVDPRLQNGEMRVIETIEDAYRVERLKERLATPILSKKFRPGIARRGYELMFLDRNGQIVATAAFYRSDGPEFVLQPTKYGSAIGGHYFPDRRDTVLPGNWESGVDYLGYAIPFPDWRECIGYAPGV